MWEALKKTNCYIIMASLIKFARLILYSIYLNITGKNTRALTDEASHRFGRELLAVVNASLTIHGHLPPIQPGRSYIVISNHPSLYDIPAVFAALPVSLRMIAKKELYRIPFFSSMLSNHEFVKIDRQNREQAMLDLKKAEALMKTGIVIWGAAEGTRSKPGELMPFKKGLFMLALDAQAIIIPLIIKGTDKILPARTLSFSTDQHVSVSIGEPIDTQGLTVNDRDNLMATVRESMENMYAAKN